MNQVGIVEARKRLNENQALVVIFRVLVVSVDVFPAMLREDERVLVVVFIRIFYTFHNYEKNL